MYIHIQIKLYKRHFRDILFPVICKNAYLDMYKTVMYDSHKVILL